METIDSKVELIKADIKSLGEKVASIKIVDDETQKVAINFLADIKGRMKRIEELRKFFTSDLVSQTKKINNTFKAQIEPLEQFEIKIKGTLKVYMDEQDRLAQIEADKLRKEQEAKEAEERKAREEADRLAKAAAKSKDEEERKKLEAQAAAANAQADLKQKEAEAILPMEAAPKSVRTEGGQATRAMVWKWEVENEKLLRKTHPELFQLDVKLVNQMIQSGERQIAGLKIFQTSQISIR